MPYTGDDLARVRAMLRARPELADLTMSYGDEHRPIHFAVMQRSGDMVRLLMRHGANARLGIHPRRDATAAWTIARERGYGEIVAIIEEEESKRAGGEASGETEVKVMGDEAARAAAASGDLEWLRAQHAGGNLVNAIRWSGGGLLTVAVRNNRTEVLELLLDYGFDPDERSSIGEGDWVAYSQGYPLWYCAALGKVDGGDTAAARGRSERARGLERVIGIQRLQSQAMGDGGIFAAAWRRGERGYGGHLPADGSSETDAGGRGARGTAGGDCGARQAGGGGV